MAGECFGVVDSVVVLDRLPRLENIIKAKVSADFSYVALLQKDRVLQVFSLNQGKGSLGVVCVSDVDDVTWQKSKSRGCSRLAFVTQNDTLEVWEVQECAERLELKPVMDGQQIIELLDGLLSTSDTRMHCKTMLLEFCDNIVTAVLCEWHLLSLNICDASVVSHLSVNHITSSIRDLQLSSCFLFVLDNDNMYIIARDTGNMLAQVNVYDVGIEPNAAENVPVPSSLAVSAENDLVAVAFSDGSVLRISLYTSEVEEWQSDCSEDLLSRGGSLHNSESQAVDRATLSPSATSGAISEWDSRSSLGSMPGFHPSLVEDNVWSDMRHHPLPSFDEDHSAQFLGPSTHGSWWGHHIHQMTALGKTSEPSELYNIGSVGVSHKLHIPSYSSSLILQDMQVGSRTLSVWYRDNVCPEVTVIVIDPVSGVTVQKIRIAEPCTVALGTHIEQPNVVISDAKVSVLVCHTSQDKFVNRVMLHESAGAAENLSHINHWQRLSLPPALLTLGLDNRQLDMVAFYLKSCCPNLQSTNSDSSVAGVDAITSIISSVIVQNATDSSSQVFADQLVKVTLDFLMNFLLALESQASGSQSSGVLINMVQLRQLLKNTASCRLNSLLAPCLLPDVKVKDEWIDWTYECLVQDAILERRIATAQSVLMEKEERPSSYCCILSTVEEVGMHLTLSSLQHGDWQMATTLIENLGRDVQLILKGFCLHTCSSELRLMLESALANQGVLDDCDQTDLDLLHRIEGLWPGQSFDAALSQSAWQFPLVQLTCQRKCSCIKCFPVLKSLAIKIGKSANKTVSPLTSRYASLSLGWLKATDRAMRQNVISDGLLVAGGQLAQNFEGAWSCVDLWRYWLSYNCTSQLCRCIERVCGEAGSTSEGSALKMAHWAANNTLPYFRDVILNEFARYRVFCSSSLQAEEASVAIGHLSQIGAVFSLAHPTALLAASMTQVEFLRGFVSYCVQNKLVHVLLELVDCIPQEYGSLFNNDVGSWLTALVDFTDWESFPYSVDHVSKVCLTGFLSPSIPMKTTYLELLAEPLAGVATLLYSRRPLSQVMVSSTAANAIGQVDKALLQASLRPKYPQLELALCQETSELLSFDVFVHDLLKVNEPFDVDHLFHWRTNSVIPFCSQPEMVRLHGHQVELDFVYYLSQARPCFAIAKLLAQELLLKNTLHVQRVNGATALASGFAFKSFLMAEVSAACVAFVEMLARDSTWLRITLEAAQLIANSYDKEALKNFNRENATLDLVRLLAAVAKQQQEACATLLQLLEDAVESSLCRLGGFGRIAMEPLVLLGLVTGFCRAHCLPLKSTLLEKYAKESNWLMVLLCAQCHLLPKEDVKSLVDNVANCAVREHLQNVLVHLHVKHKTVVTSSHTVRPRDTRHTLYEKIGLAREKSRIIAVDDQQLSDPDDGMHSSSDETTDSMSGSVELGSDGPTIHTNLLTVILETGHMLQDAWQPLINHALLTSNSTAVLLADRCLGVPTDFARRLGLLSIWLVVSADEAYFCQIADIASALSNRLWVLDDIITIVIRAMQAQRFTLLIQGLSIFVPESPLVPLIKFLASIVTGDKKKSSEDWLKNFIQALEIVDEATIGLNREQLDQICIRLLCHAAGCCPSLRQAYYFLLTLQRYGIKNYFCTAVVFPDLALALSLLVGIISTGIRVNVRAFLWGAEDVDFEPECRRALSLLIEGFHFKEARTFSQAANLGQETVLTAQLHEDLCRRKSLVEWQDPNVRHTFWAHCRSTLSGDSKTETTVSFLLTMTRSTKSHSERFFLFHLALQAQNTQRKEEFTSTFSSLETDMWKSRFEAEMALEFVGAEGKTFLDVRIQDGLSPHDLLRQGQFLSFPEGMVAGHCVTTEKEQQAVCRIIGQQLDHGCLGPALKLAVYFDHRPRDLVLLQTCLSVAESRISNDQADSLMRSMSDQGVGDYPRRRLSRLAVRRSSFVGSEHEDLEEQLASKETLAMLERLRDSCTHGSAICNLIVTYFRVACVLDLNFSYIVEHPNVFAILKMLLKSSAGDKFVLARELATARAIPDTLVAEFVAEEALSALCLASASCDLPNSSAIDYSLVSLCQEPLLIGNHLLEVAKSTDADAFHIQVELCVLAHHCFSLACSTEGITRVLGRAKVLACTLAEVEEFVLMVRLLTGIGRYSELTCILDLLLDNHQFELLLKKGMEKITDLKMALLDYLRRCHPSDTDMFTMVALHFLLFREIGKMHEDEAQTKLQTLSTKTLDNSRATIEQLENILQFWADAAESYSKADCPRLGQRCCRQASLVALQLHLLPSGQRLLNLESSQVNDFIVGHPNFPEACLVAEVYSEHRVWPQAFYQQVVVRGNTTYLHDFHNHLGVAPSLIQDIVCRFKKEENATEKMAEHLKRAIRLTKNVSVLHQLAIELSFQDLAAQVLDGDGGAFICDTFGT